MTTTGSLQQPVVSFSYPATNKAFQIPEDTSCLNSFLYGKHKLLASVDVFLHPKLCIQTWIPPVNPEFIDSVIQRFINLV
ncbi:hypothetical protein Tco_1339803 [Tanacetum coccineum]